MRGRRWLTAAHGGGLPAYPSAGRSRPQETAQRPGKSQLRCGFWDPPPKLGARLQDAICTPSPRAVGGQCCWDLQDKGLGSRLSPCHRGSQGRPCESWASLVVSSHPMGGCFPGAERLHRGHRMALGLPPSSRPRTRRQRNVSYRCLRGACPRSWPWPGIRVQMACLGDDSGMYCGGWGSEADGGRKPTQGVIERGRLLGTSGGRWATLELPVEGGKGPGASAPSVPREGAEQARGAGGSPRAGSAGVGSRSRRVPNGQHARLCAGA